MIQVNKADFNPCHYDDETVEMTAVYKEKEVILSVYIGDVALEDFLPEIERITSRIVEFDQQGKQLIYEELGESYNQHNPQNTLAEEAFKEKLDLFSLYFSGDEEVEFTYEANGMFGTHILSVELIEGVFTEWVSMNG
ncbi:hypothetical protein [Myroides odoratus]|uniref:hypothetical protein n=1 Tax=Myroides odoratus TaxID=256 RepID=UPI0039AEBBC3